MATIRLTTDAITDRETFHSVFQRIFGFPSSYGRNMDAWIDCMSCLDDPAAGMSTIVLQPGELLLLSIPDAEPFQQRVPDVFAQFIACTTFVNRRYLERDGNPRIGLLLF